MPDAAGNYVLSRDVTLDNTWNVQDGDVINLCLNGKNIRAGGSSYNVITVSGGATLNLYDCSDGQGSVTGGYVGIEIYSGSDFNMYGGAVTGADQDGVDVSGAFNMYGGTITGNNGGVNCWSGYAFHMAGGAIIGNDRGGVTVASRGTFSVSGTPVIRDNTHSGTVENVNLPANAVIHVSGALEEGALIGVTMETPGVFTDGLSGNGNHKSFFSDAEAYMVFPAGDGEAALGSSVTITYDLNGEAGDAPVDANNPHIAGDEVTVPAGVDSANYTFTGWNTRADGSGTAYQPGDTLTLSEDTTLYAQWIHEHEGVSFQPWSATDALPDTAGSYFLLNDVDLNDVYWDVPTGAVNLCLNGHTISTRAVDIGPGSTFDLCDCSGNQGVIQAPCGMSVISADQEVGGTFNMHGGKITGSRDYGVYCTDGTTFTMTDGAITGNNYGAYIDSNMTQFAISGSPVIQGNTNWDVELDKTNNKHVKISVVGELSEGARIGVKLGSGGGGDVITSGLPGNGGAGSFFSNDSARIIWLNDSGEARLATFWTVTFDSDGGSAVEAQRVAKSQRAARPDDPSREGFIFQGWYLVTNGVPAETAFDFENTNITSNITLKAVWEKIPVFGTPDFVIPAGTLSIGDNAFEGIAATVVEIPEDCANIGAQAFKGCASLTMIRIPAGCAVGTDAFDGCGKVYIFGAAGSPAEAYCENHGNCVFVEDGQN